MISLPAFPLTVLNYLIWYRHFAMEQLKDYSHINPTGCCVSCTAVLVRAPAENVDMREEEGKRRRIF